MIFQRKSVRLGWRLSRLVVLAAGVGLGAQALAQVADQDPVTPDNGLNIPKDVVLFGKQNPDIRKATAIVDGHVITGTDVDQRLALILAANNIKPSEEERDQLRLQVLRSLIDETLQIEQAKTADITVTPAEEEQSFARVSQNFQKTVPEMRAYLTSIGSSEKSLKRQIEAELAWSRYLRRRVEPFVNVGDEEVKAILDRLEASKGAEEYHLKEIYFSSSPDRDAQVAANVQKVMEGIRANTAPFEYFAHNFSEASTRAVNGDLGWVRAAQLPPELAAAAQAMQVGQVQGPIAVPGGFSILYLADKRKVLSADPRDAILSLRQLTINFPKGLTKEQATQRAATFSQQIQAIRGCGEATKAAQQIGAEVVDNDHVRIRDLPPQLQDILLNLQVGQATPPFGSVTEGVRSLVLCGRDDPQGGQLPAPGQVQSQLEQQRVNLRAQQMLRDLRRDAIIEYR